MWVRFTADFDWKPTPQSITAYKAGMVLNVPRACAEAACRVEKAVKDPSAGKRKSDDAVEA
ncbi:MULTISPECIES: hypothetical protein [unclassified Mesorhizobium]|uniref:hypothetical protein n=1 Tax=unclassified Mesorhizobium TaxID=325217 RepID=UPI001CD16A60|nr:MULTISPECIES: hypothetical protein [unclassified Mesorhizobium]MCA0025475.1 hypothetical protein [Mesorhizobium sp. B263B1A]